MNRKLFTAGLSATVVLAFAASTASATIIGDPSQTSQQGVNGAQDSNAATATGNVIDVGPTSSAPSSAVQVGVNLVGNAQSVGTGSTTQGSTIISPDNIGPSQSSEQGVNALQGSENSAIGTQVLINGLGNSQIVGGDQDCLIVACAASTIIGSPAQYNGQALNYQQAADGGVTSGDSYLTPNVSFNGLVGSTSQFSINGVGDSQLIIG
ncbi:MAG TPA: hypothetical protein VHW26_07685 [Solirubrobacteraceae bacterium]|jgi:hypothetical protein|nr:hypothetical protein [Solirubrobacteraceae bacterium]